MKLKYSILLIIVLLISSCDDQGIDPIYGCTDSIYDSYNPNANIDDGSCCEFYNSYGNINTDCPSYFKYEPDIYSFFSINGCLDCHVGTSNGGLDLSTYTGTINGGNNGSIINFDNPLESILLTTFDNGGVMCDNIGMCELDDDDFNLIFTWIVQGALEN